MQRLGFYQLADTERFYRDALALFSTAEYDALAFLEVHGLRLGQAKYLAQRSRWSEAGNLLLKANLPLECIKLCAPSGPDVPDGEVLLEAMWQECCFSLVTPVSSERMKALLQLVNLYTTRDGFSHADIEVCVSQYLRRMTST